MADLNDIISYASSYLAVEEIKDYGPQGLQVAGAREVFVVVTGVSACMELFSAAKEKGAQLVMVHHGMFWDNDPVVVKGSLKKRLAFLLKNEMSLAGYHLALDRHDKVGNNIQLVKTLDLKEPAPFGRYGDKSIGYIAHTQEPRPAGDFVEMVRQKINPGARHYDFGAKKINRVAILSGGAPQIVREAVAQKADLYLTGEETEWIYHFAKEESIHYVAAGHHATERFGIKALGEMVGEKFDVDVEFIDINNPI